MSILLWNIFNDFLLYVTENLYITTLLKLEDIIRYRRLRWLGNLSRIECHRIPRQAHHWEPDGFRRRPGRPRQNWRGVINKDLKKIGIGWDEVQEAAEDRRSWWIRFAQWVFEAGWTRNQVLRQLKPALWNGLNRLNGLNIFNSELWKGTK